MLLVVAVDSPDALLKEGPDEKATYLAAINLYGTAPSDRAPSATAWGHVAEAWLRIGDLEGDDDHKLAAYEKGLAAAEKGIALDDQCTECWFWKGADLGRYGQTKGILKSLSLLGDVKGAFQKVLAIDPKHMDARLSLGLIDQKVPGFAGGSVERAEVTFRGVLKDAPGFTRARLDLGELLWDAGKKDEARKLALSVLDEKAPLYPGEHRKFDVKRARKLLASWS